MPQLTEGRFGAGTCILADTIYVVGGDSNFFTSNNKRLNSIERLSLAAGGKEVWQLLRLETEYFYPRLYPAVFALNSASIFILGGSSDEGRLSDGFRLDIRSPKARFMQIATGSLPKL